MQVFNQFINLGDLAQASLVGLAASHQSAQPAQAGHQPAGQPAAGHGPSESPAGHEYFCFVRNLSDAIRWVLVGSLVESSYPGLRVLVLATLHRSVKSCRLRWGVGAISGDVQMILDVCAGVLTSGVV